MQKSDNSYSGDPKGGLLGIYGGFYQMLPLPFTHTKRRSAQKQADVAVAWNSNEQC